MKESSFWRYFLAAVGLVLIAVAAHSASRRIFDNGPRYMMQAAAEGSFIYKMDLQSGHIWVVHQGFVTNLPDNDERANQDAAIKRAQFSHSLANDSGTKGSSWSDTNQELIKGWLETLDSVTTISGWSAHHTEGDTYLVKCAFKKADGYGSAWWFEVNLSASTVRSLSLTTNSLANNYYRGVKSGW